MKRSKFSEAQIIYGLHKAEFSTGLAICAGKSASKIHPDPIEALRGSFLESCR